jgi:hypothetical protein
MNTWVKAKNLKPGDTIVTTHGPLVLATTTLRYSHLVKQDCVWLVFKGHQNGAILLPDEPVERLPRPSKAIPKTHKAHPTAEGYTACNLKLTEDTRIDGHQPSCETCWWKR